MTIRETYVIKIVCLARKINFQNSSLIKNNLRHLYTKCQHKYETRHRGNLTIAFNSPNHMNSLENNIKSKWNNLPENIKMIERLSLFKKSLRKYITSTAQNELLLDDVTWHFSAHKGLIQNVLDVLYVSFFCFVVVCCFYCYA